MYVCVEDNRQYRSYRQGTAQASCAIPLKYRSDAGSVWQHAWNTGY